MYSYIEGKAWWAATVWAVVVAASRSCSVSPVSKLLQRQESVAYKQASEHTRDEQASPNTAFTSLCYGKRGQLDYVLGHVLG